jgi:tetratricopeptide (TPR) repeat protein
MDSRIDRTAWTRSIARWGLIVACATLVGCASSGDDGGTMAQPVDTGDGLAGGADRAPTAQTLHSLGRVLIGQGKASEGEAVLQNCLRRYPAYAPAYAELAGLYVRHHRIDEAALVLESGIAQASGDAVLRNDLGMCHFLRKDYGAARDAFDAAVELSNGDTRYRANRALAAGFLGEYDAALAEYHEIMLPGEAHYNLAVIAEARGDTVRAQEEYQLAAANGVTAASRDG